MAAGCGDEAARWKRGIGPNVLVTGTNRGIGLGLVRELLKRSEVKRIFATCREPEKATALKELEKQHPGLIHLVRLDVCNDASIKLAVGEVTKALDESANRSGQGYGKSGGLNLLINNAGIMEQGKGVSLLEPERQTLLRHFDTNVVGLAILTSAFLPLLKRAATGGEPSRVLNITAMLASSSLVHNAQYRWALTAHIAACISKAALNQYTNALGDTLKEVKIVVAAMCPGWVRTELGGSNANLSVEESAAAVVAAAARLDLSDNGTYFDKHGPIPY